MKNIERFNQSLSRKELLSTPSTVRISIKSEDLPSYQAAAETFSGLSVSVIAQEGEQFTIESSSCGHCERDRLEPVTVQEGQVAIEIACSTDSPLRDKMAPYYSKVREIKDASSQTQPSSSPRL